MREELLAQAERWLLASPLGDEEDGMGEMIAVPISGIREIIAFLATPSHPEISRLNEQVRG
jgi:hypothetical protein